MGDTAFLLIIRPKEVIAHYIDVRRAHKFNFVRMLAMADGHWPFGGAPQRPDYAVINEPAMRKMDWVFDYAASKGMNIELILWGYGVEGGVGRWGNAARENFWIDTLVKRYKDRPNLFMYTPANEFERYPDGKYSYAPATWNGSRRGGPHPSIRQGAHNRAHPSPDHRGQAVLHVWRLHNAPGRNGRLLGNGQVNVNVTQNNEGSPPRSGAIQWRQGLTYYPTRGRIIPPLDGDRLT
jgi:hypothetical protein